MIDNHLSPENAKGLSDEDIPGLLNGYGKNIFQPDPPRRLLHIILDILKEPMFILLAIACSLYFILGEETEGIMMLLAMSLVTAISLYQEVKSTNALKALQQYTAPRVTVLRNGKETIILTEDLLPGDVMFLNEGMHVPA
ncbi:MAG TPA: cation-transporting P-type ATPase, partial [Ferruginibacter sp.]|nr:cation-transporting P-type ATPase [Ferruginibacter sp.]